MITESKSRTSRDAPTGHKLFNFISFSYHSRRWAHIKRYARKCQQKMPSIRTQVDMKSEIDGGRHAPFWSNYRPHLIPEGSEDYLGVTAIGITEEHPIEPGSSAEVAFDLCYHPNVDYAALSEGTYFQIREGARVVGTGTVLERLE